MWGKRLNPPPRFAGLNPPPPVAVDLDPDPESPDSPDIESDIELAKIIDSILAGGSPSRRLDLSDEDILEALDVFEEEIDSMPVDIEQIGLDDGGLLELELWGDAGSAHSSDEWSDENVD